MNNILLNPDFRSNPVGTTTIDDAFLDASDSLAVADSWSLSAEAEAADLTGSLAVRVLEAGRAVSAGYVASLPPKNARNVVIFTPTSTFALAAASPGFTLSQSVDKAFTTYAGKDVVLGFMVYVVSAGLIKFELDGSFVRNGTGAESTSIHSEYVNVVPGWNEIRRTVRIPECPRYSLNGGQDYITTDSLTVSLTIDNADNVDLIQTAGDAGDASASIALTGVYLAAAYDEMDELTRAQNVAAAAAAATTTGVTTTIEVLALIGGGAYYTLVIEDGVITSANLTTP